MQLQENTLFANRYQLERLLGRGGFSEVWQAKDNWTHLQIALKIYAPGQGMDVCRSFVVSWRMCLTSIIPTC